MYRCACVHRHTPWACVPSEVLGLCFLLWTLAVLCEIMDSSWPPVGWTHVPVLMAGPEPGFRAQSEHMRCEALPRCCSMPLESSKLHELEQDSLSSEWSWSGAATLSHTQPTLFCPCSLAPTSSVFPSVKWEHSLQLPSCFEGQWEDWGALAQCLAGKGGHHGQARCFPA